VRLVDVNTAHATTTIFELSRGRAADDGPVIDSPSGTGDYVNMAQYGVYFDEFSKASGRWLFTHRRFVQCYLEHGAWNGDLPNPRSSLVHS
jgi:hypothetical protein